MEHLILTETEFFRLIDNPDSRSGLNAAYNEFTMAVVSLCTGAASPCHPLPALSKALAFVRKMLKHLALPHSQVPPLSSIPSKDEKRNDMPADAPPMRWTGKASDLVEILYGMAEMGCINDGEITVGELAAFFYSLFNVEAKDCYRIYSDLKLRKNDSRTYFLDKMQEKLNKRMDMDEERERTRR